MFTGIVQEVVSIAQLVDTAQCRQITLSLPVYSNYLVGDSVLLNGICSTVVHITAADFTVEYMPQTQQRTTVGDWSVGQLVNCESPLTLQTKISGSLVTGHIDGVGEITQVERNRQLTSLTLQVNQALPPMVVAQGSLTVDGVNLTVAQLLTPRQARLDIIPHTQEHTSITSYLPGRRVNIEYDYIAKLVLQLPSARLTDQVVTGGQ
jgi:riboflavin synthase